MNKIKFWIDNARSIALPQSILPSLLAISVSALHDGFSWWMAIVALFGVICAHLGALSGCGCDKCQSCL
jgi:1,4-dihydroxy-2-naphthoate octaprenyltransferase